MWNYEKLKVSPTPICYWAQMTEMLMMEAVAALLEGVEGLARAATPMAEEVATIVMVASSSLCLFVSQLSSADVPFCTHEPWANALHTIRIDHMLAMPATTPTSVTLIQAGDDLAKVPIAVNEQTFREDLTNRCPPCKGAAQTGGSRWTLKSGGK